MNPSDLPTLVGSEIGVSEWLQVTQRQVDAFAEITGDHQWIHVDVSRAERENGGTIAHGFLILSLIATLGKDLLVLSGMSQAINYGSNKVRFVSPVRVGSWVRLCQRLLAADPHPAGFKLVFACTIEIDGEIKPACVAETIRLVLLAG